ncbi:hypothetical protein FSS13T_24190 [Flavobacterium saliperosum S13]|uniref:Uncharacterized protein n=2 Tax=Flavobacterium saliperosum TaxID=329186 RepID=A0A1G4W791_9FLAO|nr:hypothetical protein [Flavobacterium saliperosum]ESU22968.1 hypothetical protein FSS13T_24190 [Flavobacterium saliperosum S13]SCX17894.1 hypothetical protein SAMN02927925_02606 [Flavobacterium saliperosum]
MKKNITYILFLFSCLSYSQVGIGTSSPQQDLHVAGTTSTIRIESLNSVNQPALNDGVKLAPVYAKPNGDLTLNPPGFTTGGGAGTNEPLNFLISIPNFIPNGPYGDGTVVANPVGVTNATQQIVSVPFNSPQNSLIEVRYAMTIDLSDQFLPAPAASTFNDISARTVRCYFYIDLNNDGLDPVELSKVYGLHGEAYTSFSQGSVGYAFIHGVGYGNIPAGTHSLVFFGETSDGNNRDTYVGFGGSSDYLKIRIYN